MKELTDFPENDQEDPTEVFTDFISGGDLSLMEPIICHMDPISEQVEIHLLESRRASDGRSRPGGVERETS